MGHTNAAPRRTVAIVQPYVPAYRVAFFEGLRSMLHEQGVDLRVIADDPDSAQLARRDAAPLPWVEYYSERRVRLGRRTIRLGTAYPLWKDCDAVVVGHLGSSLDTNLALALAAISSRKVGVWGHIGSYVDDANPLDAFVERWQLRRAAHVFAYTPGGALLASELGAAPERVTAVMNTVDTSAIEEAVEKADDASATQALGRTFDRRKTFSFIGALDSSKRIGFLSDALERVWNADPEIRILVAGRGSEEALLAPAVDRGQVILLGYADPGVKAALGRATRAVLMPGRIGLIAVDALVLGLPILSTSWPYHAPESEYLDEGVSLLKSHDSPEAYAELILSESASPVRAVPRNYPRLEDMVESFASGVISLLEA